MAYVLKSGQHWMDGKLYTVGMKFENKPNLPEDRYRLVEEKEEENNTESEDGNKTLSQATEKELSGFLNGSLTSIKTGLAEDTWTKEQLSRLHQLEQEGKKRPLVMQQIQEAFQKVS